jgi:tripartite-type tricarboxylate transporter receptor subunit TctC
MLDRRRLLVATVLSPVALSGWAQVPASDWPNKPVKIVVGFPPGQASDVGARMYAAELQKAFGQAFVVENRPGVGATLAARDVSRAAPDGYSLLYTSSGPLTVAPHLYSKLGFDPLKDLELVGLLGRSPLFLLVPADSPLKTVRDLIAASAKRELSCGSGGNGVTNHLALEMFKQVSGAKLLHVPYKGAAPALQDLMGGAIELMFETTPASLPQVRTGRLRPLAVTSSTRLAELPDVPTMAEIFPGFEVMTWSVFAVPKGAPAAIVDKLAAQLNKIQADPVFKAAVLANGAEPTPNSTPAKARAYAVAESEKWRDIIRRANIKLD